MILVTIGTMPHFERLIRQMDLLAEHLDEDVFMQIGQTRYQPKHAQWERYVDDLSPYYDRARLVVSHGGFSTLETIRQGKQLIVVPRQHRYREHFDDHQVEFAKILQDRFGVPFFLDEKQMTVDFVQQNHVPKPFDHTPVQDFRREIDRLVAGDTEPLNQQEVIPKSISTPRPTPSVRHNTVASLTGIIGANASHYLIGWLVVISLGETAHGVFSVVLSFVTITVLLALSGLMEVRGVREIARELATAQREVQAQVDAIVGVGLTVSLILGVALFVSADWLGNWLGSDTALLIRWAAPWPLAMALLRIGTMLGDGFERMWASAFCSILFHGSRLIWLIVAVLLALPLSKIFAGWAIVMPLSGCVCACFTQYLLRRQGLRLRLSLASIFVTIRWITHSIPLTVARSTAAILPGAAAILIASAGGNKRIVSYFVIAYGLAAAPMILTAAITNAVFPAIARLIRQSDAAEPRITRPALRLAWRSIGMILAVHLCALAGYWIFGRQLLEIIYGANYADRHATLLILTGSVAIEGARHLIAHLLMAHNQGRVLFLIELMRYLVMAVLIVMWVPGYGARGAAAAVFAGTAMNVLGHVGILQKTVQHDRPAL